MKSRSKDRFLTKSIVLVSCIAFVGVVAATFAGGYLIDHLLRQEAIRAEGKRLTQLVKLFVEQEFDENVLNHPESPDANSKYTALVYSPIFTHIEQLRYLGVWGPKGRLIWWFGEEESPLSQKSRKDRERLKKAQNGAAQYFMKLTSHRDNVGGENTNSLLISLIPLWEKEKEQGGAPSLVLGLYTEPRAFLDELDRLRARVWEITAAVGVIIFLMTLVGILRIGHFHEIAKRHASRMEISGAIAKAVGSTLEPNELFRIIVEEIRRAVPCDRCSIAGIDENTKQVALRHHNTGVKLSLLSEEESLRRGMWIYENVYKTKSPACLSDVNDENGMLLRLYQEAGIQTLLFVPILQDGECVAHLSLSSKDARAFSREDEELLTSIASQISPAIQNANLYKISNERSARLEILQKLNRQIAENLNLQKVLDSIVNAVAELLQCDFVQIYFAEENDEILVARCWGGSVPDPPSRQGGRTSFPVKNSVGGSVYETGTPAILPDVQQIPSWIQREWVQKVGLRSFISQRLRHGGESIGIINCMSREKDFFGQDDLELLGGLASQAAIAIANARLYEEDTRRASRLETLQSLTRKLNENLGLPDLLAAVTDGSAELLDATRVAVITLENKKNAPEVLYKHGLSSAYTKSLMENYKDTTLPEAMKRMEPVAIPDVFTCEYPVSHQLASDEGFAALLSVPLMCKGVCFGVLMLYWDAPREFSPVDIRLAQAFGDQTANAVQNARLHEEAQRSRDFFQSIMDDNADAMMISDENRKILRWNPAAERLYGYSEAEILGRSIECLIPEECPDDIDVGKKARKYGNEVVFDSYRLRKDGTPVPVSISISPIKDEGGNIIAFCGIHKDLTIRQTQEEELRQARDEAEAATRAKSEFLANMSHEIRTPMNGVIGMTSLLLDTELSDQQHSYAETVRSSAEGLLAVINDILDFSKIEAGKLTADPVPIDLHLTVDEVVDQFSFQVNEKNLGLLFYLSPDVPRYVIGDPGRIRQILNNLIGNAVKFTETGHVLIHVETQAPDSGAGNIRFSIEDTGIGIPENKISLMFDQFSQADASTTRRFGGSGLGLAISKHLSEMMGGSMGATSREGEGSTFWFTLDLPTDPEKSSLESLPAQLEGIRALIVDDLVKRQDVLGRQLKSWGMRPDFRASAVESLVALREANESGDPYEMVILECDLPDLSGANLARSIKNDPDFQFIPLVVVVPSFDRLKENAIAEAGFSAYLVRPLRQARLMDVLVSVQEAQKNRKLGESIPGFSLDGFAGRNGSREEEGDQRIEARILVAEDNPVNQLVAKKTLESFGCQVDIASNGKEAFEMHGVLPYDLIFMDCQMPEMDGFESTRNIRRAEEESGGRIPIIAMTAHAMGDAREECLRVGMDDYISKPIKKEVLRAILVQWVSEQGEQSSKQDAEEIHPLSNGGRGSGQESFDLDVLTQLKSIQQDGNPDILEGLFSVFVRDVPSHFSTLRGSLTDNDAGALKKAAHHLKGSTSQLGIVRMANLCASLEEKGESGSLDGAEMLMDYLEREYQDVEKLIAEKPWENA